MSKPDSNPGNLESLRPLLPLAPVGGLQHGDGQRGQPPEEVCEGPPLGLREALAVRQGDLGVVDGGHEGVLLLRARHGEDD